MGVFDDFICPDCGFSNPIKIWKAHCPKCGTNITPWKLGNIFGWALPFILGFLASWLVF
jgi:hypothetical protein